MKTGRILATVVAIVVGLLVLIDVFVIQWPNNLSDLNQITQKTGALLVSWTAVVLAFALFLGFANVVSVHWSRIRSQKAAIKIIKTSPAFIQRRVLSLINHVLFMSVCLVQATTKK